MMSTLLQTVIVEGGWISLNGGSGIIVENGRNLAKNCMNLKEFGQFFINRKKDFPKS